MLFHTMTYLVQFCHIFLCCFCIFALLSVFLFSLSWAGQDGIKQLKRLHQIPCSRCAYFTGDYNLKCTVRPCEALTESAICCRDFEPRSAPQPISKSKKNVPSFSLHSR
ncbi:hypothetical protein LEP3755_04690 [Leptolyngbya sp. NIES-3755]|nr:hypothetical protein LEP3755_04690 [Leptolyngbya sp. NIES-3755]